MRDYIYGLIRRIDSAKKIADEFELPRQAAAHRVAMEKLEILRDEARRLHLCLLEEFDRLYAERREDIRALAAVVEE